MKRIKSNNRYILVALSLMLLSACKVGKMYERPEMPMPTQFAQAPATDSSVADLQWNHFFTDAGLVALIDKALHDNFDLQVAVKRMEISKEYVKQAKLSLLPNLNLQATAATTIPSKNSLNGLSLENFLGTNHIEDYNFSAGFSWEIDVWGKIRRQKEATIADYLQSYEGMKAVQTALVANIAQGYFNLLMLDAQLHIAQYNLSLSDTIVRMMRLQKIAGEVTELAVQQAISQQQTAAVLVPQLQQAITVQEHALNLLVGDMPGTVVRTDNTDTKGTVDNFDAGVPVSLLSRRPDVRASEMALMAANARVGVAQAQRYPSLNITAQGGLNAFKASTWFNIPASLFGTAAGSLLQPVFQQRRLKTQFEVAKKERETAVIQFRQSTYNAVREVSDALSGIERLNQQQALALAKVDTLNHAIKNAQLLFKSGMANYLEVISVQSNALQAQLDLASVKRQQRGSVVELYRSLGGGWR